MTQTLSPFSGEKILIADDDDVIAQLAALLLQRRGFRVFRAADGEECLRMVAEHRPALVLLDYMMPVMNGLDALKLIRAQYSDSYVVMFTGRGSEEVAV
ncbi:MAG: hybrid sensor histidine kinase/response regulator, partial [Desulfuromonas sp.]